MSLEKLAKKSTKEIPESLKGFKMPEPLDTFMKLDRYVGSGKEYHVFTTKVGAAAERKGFFSGLAYSSLNDLLGHPRVAKFPTSATRKGSMDKPRVMQSVKNFSDVGGHILTSFTLVGPFFSTRYGSIFVEKYAGPYDISRLEFTPEARADFKEIMRKQFDSILDVHEKLGYVIDGRQANFVVDDSDPGLRRTLQEALDKVEKVHESLKGKEREDVVKYFKGQADSLRSLIDNISRSGVRYDISYVDRGGIIVPGQDIGKDGVRMVLSAMLGKELDAAMQKEMAATGKDDVSQELVGYVKQRLHDQFPGHEAKELEENIDMAMESLRGARKRGIDIASLERRVDDLKPEEEAMPASRLKPKEPAPGERMWAQIMKRPNGIDFLKKKVPGYDLVHSFKDVILTGQIIARTWKNTVHRTEEGVVVKHPSERMGNLDVIYTAERILSGHIPISRLLDFVFTGDSIATREEYRGEDLWNRVLTREEVENGTLERHVEEALGHMMTVFEKAGVAGGVSYVLDGDLSNFTLHEGKVNYVSKSLHKANAKDAAEILAREAARLVSSGIEKGFRVTGKRRADEFMKSAERKIMERAPTRGKYVMSLVRSHVEKRV